MADRRPWGAGTGQRHRHTWSAKTALDGILGRQDGGYLRPDFPCEALNGGDMTPNDLPGGGET